jgi:RHS repeat-associated protein
MGDDTYNYAYDSIGNRLLASQTVASVTSELEYVANALNQYTNILTAVDSVPSVATPSYDDDGNMLFLPSTTGGGAWGEGWALQWNGENRLIAASNSVSGIVVKSAYDHQGRRITKTTIDQALGTTNQTQFVYDGWNLIAENDGASTNNYVWCLDLSGSMQGAGGIGGLIATKLDGQIYFSCFDANGNLTDYVDTNGTVAAHYEYSPFGQTIAETGPMADQFNFGFSTHYKDRETGLIYCKNRYYDPETGRWLSRDAIGEEGGINLYTYVLNNPVLYIDPYGLALYAFDGTWNDRKKMKRPTNVAKLVDLYRGAVHYEKGVGTDWYTKHVGGATGAGGQNRLEAMYEALTRIYNTPDPTGENQKIDIIGFSRGAALARAFVNYINKKGGVPVTGPDGKATDTVCPVKIRFVGVFDTVGSFGIPGNKYDLGYDLSIPDNVEHVRHAVAADEKRKMFPLSSVLEDPANPNANWRIVEQAFRGAHSDIGGGYEEGDRSNFALMWMRDEAVRCGVPFDPLKPEDVGAHNPIMHDERGWWERWRNKDRKIYYPNASQ